MKLLCQLIAALALAGALGCGESDPNKDLKPIDPNAPRPQQGKVSPGGDDGEKSPPIIK